MFASLYVDLAADQGFLRRRCFVFPVAPRADLATIKSLKPSYNMGPNPQKLGILTPWII